MKASTDMPEISSVDSKSVMEAVVRPGCGAGDSSFLLQPAFMTWLVDIAPIDGASNSDLYFERQIYARCEA